MAFSTVKFQYHYICKNNKLAIKPIYEPTIIAGAEVSLSVITAAILDVLIYEHSSSHPCSYQLSHLISSSSGYHSYYQIFQLTPALLAITDTTLTTNLRMSSGTFRGLAQSAYTAE